MIEHARSRHHHPLIDPVFPAIDISEKIFGVVGIMFTGSQPKSVTFTHPGSQEPWLTLHSSDGQFQGRIFIRDDGKSNIGVPGADSMTAWSPIGESRLSGEQFASAFSFQYQIDGRPDEGVLITIILQPEIFIPPDSIR